MLINYKVITVLNIPFDNTFARLPERFFVRMNPVPVAAPKMIKLNAALAQQLGLDLHELSSPDGLHMFAGNRVPQNSEPVAMAYAGHQFGSWVPQLGDGRAILLGEVIDQHGTRYDVQLKGSGRTPFSRSGDGRAWLGPVLREYIVSEAMAALGVPTTRALAAVSTGEIVRREELFPGAILTRVARSHIRIGTFQFFSASQDIDALRHLTNYVIKRYYPEAENAPIPCLAMLEEIVERQAKLVAQWQCIGFIHGVMNTDNMSVAGETIDFGPCAFMDHYHPETVFSYIDQMGRYAYQNQPSIALWNLAQLANTLLPLIADDTEIALEQAQVTINSYSECFEQAYLTGMRAKLGLTEVHDNDITLINDLLERMAENHADFTLTFRGLSELSISKARDNAQNNVVRNLFDKPAAFDQWMTTWRQRLIQESSGDSTRRAAMLSINPAVIPRNHQVEAVIQAAVSDNDFIPFEQLMLVLAKPYEDQSDYQQYTLPPQPEEVVRNTFCGT